MGSQTSATGNRRQGRILVVADVAAERKSINTTLAHTGYEVVEAESGEQAIKLAQDVEHPFVIDVVLCDIRMPPGDGVETMAFFRRRGESINTSFFKGGCHGTGKGAGRR
ncbi:MAG: response regulator [Chloroflexi bacterium]|nr:MAG: response regulator [Chloroflexota bacterium]